MNWSTKIRQKIVCWLQGLKNETKQNGINGSFSGTKENEKYWGKRETKRNETTFKETNLKRKKNPFHEHKNNKKCCK
jgi:hypothetical protein